MPRRQRMFSLFSMSIYLTLMKTQAVRKAQESQPLDAEIIAKRTKRHLDELEVRFLATRFPIHYPLHPQRSNYAEPTTSYLGMDEDDQAGKSAKGRARQTVSDKRQLSGPGAKRKKANMNIRTAILYRKNFATLIEESVGVPFNGSQDTLFISLSRDWQTSPPSIPTYLNAAAGPPRKPTRPLCTVCGYWGNYKCKKCAMHFCGLDCQGVHDETRCERRVI
jgi:zinc finger HIT domain-containing protein 1